MGTKYSSNAASGYNATPPADDGTVSEANKVKWSTIKTKLTDPPKDLADTINSELVTHFNNGPNAYTTNQTLGAANYNTINQVSGAGVTLTLTDATTLGAGWYCDIVNTDATNTVSLARATAADMINETSADVTIQTLSHLRVIVNAAANGFLVTNAPRTTKAFKTAEDYTHSGTVTMSGKSMYWAKGADIVSAATLVLGSDGNMFDVTGSTGPITAITVPAGMLFMLQFDSTPTLTHHATNLNLPGGANIAAAAGDRAICFATAANTAHVLEYVKADGTPLVGTSIGIGQTPQDVVGSRALGTEYQNLTGRPIFVVVSGYGNSSGCLLTASVGAASPPATVVGYSSGNVAGELCVGAFVVPPNYYYKVDITATPTLSMWNELR